MEGYLAKTNESGDYGVTKEYNIEELNDLLMMTKLGGIIFIGILMVIGVVGNSLVLYIYTTKFKRSNHRVNILCLAMLDSVTCWIGMPFVIIGLRFPLMFRMVNVCKSLRFLKYFMSCGSALVLVVIAIDRYKKICFPFGKQMTPKHATIACGIAICIAVCLAWPAAVLYGHSTVDSETISAYLNKKINVSGVQCFTDDAYLETNFQSYYYIILGTMAFISTTILAALYYLIARKLSKQARKVNKPFGNIFQIRNNVCKHTEPVDFIGELHSSTTSSPSETSSGQQNSSKFELLQMTNNPETPSGQQNSSKFEPVQMVNIQVTKVKSSNGNGINGVSKSKDPSRRLTLMMFIITLVYVLSAVPHLSLQMISFLNPNFLPSLTFKQLFIYNIFLYSYFVNNVANPAIYGLCDKRFLKKLKQMC